jgi:hypothetical protein
MSSFQELSLSGKRLARIAYAVIAIALIVFYGYAFQDCMADTIQRIPPETKKALAKIPTVAELRVQAAAYHKQRLELVEWSTLTSMAMLITRHTNSMGVSFDFPLNDVECSEEEINHIARRIQTHLWKKDYNVEIKPAPAKSIDGGVIIRVSWDAKAKP